MKTQDIVRTPASVEENTPSTTTPKSTTESSTDFVDSKLNVNKPDYPETTTAQSSSTSTSSRSTTVLTSTSISTMSKQTSISTSLAVEDENDAVDEVVADVVETATEYNETTTTTTTR